MPLNRHTTRTFHRTLYAGILEKVLLYKRNDDQAMGTITVYNLYDCRWSRIERNGEQIQHDLSARDSRTLHVPRIEMDRHGINYFNALDRFVDLENRWWEPEATTGMTSKLFQNHWCLRCLRVDPLNNIIGRLIP